jgi:hypothetical protein
MTTQNKVQKSSDGTSVTHLSDSTIYDDGTNVGIGTTSPCSKLQIAAGDILIDQDKRLYLDGTISGNPDTNWSIGKDASHNINVRGASSGTRAFQVCDSVNSDAVRLHVEFGGNVGIGTTSPVATLDITNSITAASPETIGVNIGQTMTAHANADYMTAVKIAPIFNNNGKTNVNKFCLDIENSDNTAGCAVTGINVAVDGGSNRGIFVNGTSGAMALSAGSNNGIAIQGAGYSVSGGHGVGGYFYASDGEVALKTGPGNVGIGTDTPGSKLDVNGAVTLEPAGTPSSPAQSNEARIYIRNNKFIIQFNDGGTVRYKYLGLTGTGVTWQHTTVAP